MEFLDTIKLGFDNNLIMGNVPDLISLDKLAEKIIKDTELGKNSIESFGLFDSNQSNYNTYYPNVTAEDLHPQEGDYIQPVFRALSEVIVHKDYNPVDFSENNVLRKSMGLLNGATVNVDHEMAVGNAVGVVKDVAWQDAYKDNGVLVPAGINAKLKIDGKSNPKLSRNILMDPPAVHSTSVTVQFLWDKSHPGLTQEEFFAKLGSMDKDGKMIRRMATKVKRYHEISLVAHGADPYAQLVKDAKIVNPVWGEVSYNSVTPIQKQAQKYFLFDYKTDVIKNSIPKEHNTNNTSQKQNIIMNKEFLMTLAAIMGVTLANTEEPGETELQLIQGEISKLVALNKTNETSLADNGVQLARLVAIENSYNEEKAALAESVALKAFKDNQTTELRKKVNSQYKTLSGKTFKETDAIKKLIDTAPYETLVALDIQQTTQMEDKFPLKCGECGSQKVTRSSVTQSNEDSESVDTSNSGIKSKLKEQAKKKNRAINMFDNE